MGYIYDRWGHQQTHYYGAFSNSDELEHYGVKGMKWYQHKFGKADSRAAYAKKGGRYIRPDADDKAALERFRDEEWDDDDEFGSEIRAFKKYADYREKKYGERDDGSRQQIAEMEKSKKADEERARKDAGDYGEEDYDYSSWRNNRRNMTKYDPNTYRRLMEAGLSKMERDDRDLSRDRSAYDEDLDEELDRSLSKREARQRRGLSVSDNPMDDFARDLMRKVAKRQGDPDADDYDDDDLDDMLSKWDARTQGKVDQWSRQETARNRAAEEQRIRSAAEDFTGVNQRQAAADQAERERQERIARAVARAQAQNRSRFG